MTDRQLLERFLAERDRDSIAEIVRRHGAVVSRVCRDLIDDPHLADDVFQATFLVLLKNAGSIRDWDALDRWLYGVAYRIGIRAKRYRAQRQVREHAGVEMVADHRAAEAPDRETSARVHEEVARLPARLRDPIVLCYFENLSYDEAARRLGRPLGTLKHQLTTGRNLLRDRLRRRGVTASALVLFLLKASETPASSCEDLVTRTADLARGWAARKEVPGPIARLASSVEPPRPVSPAVALLGALILLVVGWLISGLVAHGHARESSPAVQTIEAPAMAFPTAIEQPEPPLAVESTPFVAATAVGDPGPFTGSPVPVTESPYHCLTSDPADGPEE